MAPFKGRLSLYNKPRRVRDIMLPSSAKEEQKAASATTQTGLSPIHHFCPVTSIFTDEEAGVILDAALGSDSTHVKAIRDLGKSLEIETGTGRSLAFSNFYDVVEAGLVEFQLVDNAPIAAAKWVGQCATNALAEEVDCEEFISDFDRRPFLKKLAWSIFVDLSDCRLERIDLDACIMAARLSCRAISICAISDFVRQRCSRSLDDRIKGFAGGCRAEEEEDASDLLAYLLNIAEVGPVLQLADSRSQRRTGELLLDTRAVANWHFPPLAE